jgi:bifunctional non-homologous end joining protein LigD
MANAKKKSSALQSKTASAARKSSRPAAKSAKSAAKTSTKKAARKTKSSRTSSADSVDQQLARYRSMRDFGMTAEPSGSGKAMKKVATRTSPRRAKTPTGLPFVIQKHAASHLHYDFRLGWNGVLKSWAVAKGPSYYPGDRRLAVQVEDHPMEYGGFEGIIPKGQYGGGTVMVWDQGTWWPQPGHENVDAGLRAGSLKFEMHGSKMKGKWTLVRMNPRSSSSSGSRWGSSSKPNWLLIKEHDEFERGPNDKPITEEAQNSAVTGRTMEEIAHESDHVWNSKETAGTGKAWYRQSAQSQSKSPPGEGRAPGAKFDIRPRRPSPSNASVNGASHTIPGKPSSPIDRGLKARNINPSALDKLPRETQPQFLAPELAEETTSPPEGTDWLHEIKLDGYRMQARKSGRNVQLLTRKGLDWTHRMRPVADAIAALPLTNATLDGEVVVLDDKGISSFANLQASFQNEERHPLTFFCFDLLHLEGRNTRALPLRRRKELLAQILPGDHNILRLSEHIEGTGPSIFQKACELHAEGILSKRADALYHSGRTVDWLKSKCLHEQEFVIGGYTFSSEGENRIGSLLLGYYENDKLIYSGRTGTGFTQKSRRELRTRLGKLDRATTPFTRLPPEARRAARWVEPKLVAQVRFATWTADNLVRQAAFLGLREDKPAREVRREEPTAPRPKSASHRTPSPLAAKSLTRNATRNASPEPKPPTPTKSSASSLPIHLTHPDKILDPESHLTKRQLADYYWTIAERMLPHIADRPLSLVRCPEGAGKPCFFQKHVNQMLPPGIGGIDVPNKKTGELEPYITITEDQATPEILAGFAQMGVLEVHPWGSRNGDLEHPDRIIFDLDPDEAIPWPTLCEAAAEVRKRLKRVGLESFLKTTGGKGLHIVAPIQPQLDWAAVKDATHNFVLAMERRNPALYLTKMTKAARKGKIYLDYLRNDRGATAVAPFSPRARAGAPVSLPLPWSALKLAERPIFHVADLPAWRSHLRTDPWKPMLSLRQRLDPKAFSAD